MKLLVCVVVFLGVLCNLTKCAKILGIFPAPVSSQFILGNALMKGLAEAGHDVTIISCFEEKPFPCKGSYKAVALTGMLDEFQEKMKSMTPYKAITAYSFANVVFLQLMVQPITESLFNHTVIQKLLKSNEKFDAVIVPQFGVDAVKMFAHHFKAPLITLSLIGVNSWATRLVANPEPLSYMPYILSKFPVNMSFCQRVQNVGLYLLEQLVFFLYNLPNQNKILKRYVPNAPDIYDVYYNTSLVLANSHESLGHPIPLVPNIVQIGGFHVKPPKRLPKDLQEFLDSAKDGVIYFSMGSHLKSADLPPAKRDAFLNVFRKLKQKVLWKWEDDVLPGQPANVKLGKWLPQADILGHPNVKLFITHGGFGGTTETIYHGVPILAIPVQGDQYMNANTAVRDGYALSLPYHDSSFTEEKLSSLIHDLINNPKYMNAVKEKSRLFHDRPMKPMETAVYWVEYVIRHKGARHLRVAGMDLPWYQYLLLDVFAFISVVAAAMFIVFYLLIRRLCKGRKKDEEDERKKLKTN